MIPGFQRPLWCVPAVVIFAMAWAFVTSDTSAAQVRVSLPAGVAAVSFGKAQRYKDATGKEMCAIVEPLAHPPTFDRGVTEISYGIALQPRTVKSAAARVMAPASQQLITIPCNIFMPVTGGFSQTQLGSTISRVDKQPLVPGAYRLSVTVDGQIAEIPFSVK